MPGPFEEAPEDEGERAREVGRQPGSGDVKACPGVSGWGFGRKNAPNIIFGLREGQAPRASSRVGACFFLGGDPHGLLQEVPRQTAFCNVVSLGMS